VTQAGRGDRAVWSNRLQSVSRRFLTEWLVTAAITLAAAAVLSLTHATRPLDDLAYDSLLRSAGRPTPQDILIVAIDDRSLAALGRWPWPRQVHTALLQRLARSAPAAVIYDVLFVEPQPGQDEALAKAVAACRRVYLPLLITVPGTDGAAYDVARPIAPIAQAAAALGQTNVHPDADGVVRRAFLAESDGPHVWPHLVGQAYEALHGALPWMDRAMAPGPALPALERRGEMLIPYAGPAGRMRTVSFVDVLRGQVPDAFLRGKTVFVGATAAGLADRFPTPPGDMSGVELQANMLDGLVRSAIIRPAGPLPNLIFSLLPAAALLAAFLTLRPRANAALGAGLIVLTGGASVFFLAILHLWLAPGAALAALGLAYPLWGWRRLEASSAYMLEELARLQAEPSLLEAAQPPEPGGDVVERQLALMRRQVGRMRDLRRFIGDALEGLPDATFVVSPEGQVVMRSRAARPLAEKLGVDAHEGAIAAVFQALHAADEAAALALVLGDPASVEVRAPDGARFQLGQAPIRGHDGALLGWIVRLGDVTEIRQAQARREEILQLLTHDMRSPQASILALLGSPEPVALDRIRSLAERTLALADAYVRLARAESAPLKRELVDAGDLLIEAADAVWPQARAKGVRLDAQAPDQEQLLLADGPLLERALINLIDNAVRHSPAGGVVTCRVEATRSEIAFIVVDQGPGLEPEQIAGLFKRFSVGARSAGTGLGLALAHAAAARHGGRVTCQSQPGKGARFVLTASRDEGQRASS
jgi:CHASE2 domain-containing sensor protein/signal transduction histidine kinase